MQAQLFTCLMCNNPKKVFHDNRSFLPNSATFALSAVVDKAGSVHIYCYAILPASSNSYTRPIMG